MPSDVSLPRLSEGRRRLKFRLGPRGISVLNPSFRKPIPTRRVQRTRWIRLASMARLSRPFWCWQVERERSETVGTLLPPWLVRHQLLLQVQGAVQSVFETSRSHHWHQLASSSPGARTTAAFLTDAATTAQTMTRIVPLLAAKSRWSPVRSTRPILRVVPKSTSVLLPTQPRLRSSLRPS